MPSEIPHAEKTEDSHGIFYNLVFALRATTMSFHLAKQGHDEKPSIFSIEHYEAADTAKCLEALNSCVAYYRNQSQYRAILLKGSLLSLFARLLVILTETRPSQLSDHPAISTCKKIIVNNLGQSHLSTNYLADVLQYSSTYLSFLFKQQTGENLLAYIRRKRFERARELLKASSLNISEVAWTCGFNDPGYFTRLFTRHFHMTPTQFRSLASSESFAD
jgi:AraC-like DNA-binding protein